ncbi:hypothetical protein BCAR13_60169 [Paraburkholderia caribensis]|nr:hypothetical protein BCAR13_60169 [Paraburkholderia caribensis]
MLRATMNVGGCTAGLAMMVSTQPGNNAGMSVTRRDVGAMYTLEQRARGKTGADFMGQSPLLVPAFPRKSFASLSARF